LSFRGGGTPIPEDLFCDSHAVVFQHQPVSGVIPEWEILMLNAELSRNRRLGVEFEMVIPQIGGGVSDDVRKVIAQVLTANDVPAVARGYCHRPVPHGADVCVEYDSSVRGESRYRGISWVSVEVKTRILNSLEDWEQVVPPMLDVLRYLGARVNSSCGHHIHVELSEAKDRPAVIRSLFNTIHRNENVIFGLVPPSRLTNHYCQKLPDMPGRLARCRTMSCFKSELQRLTRSSGVNWTHLWGSEPRVEYRYAASTLNVEKARHWARLMLRMTDHACNRTCKATKVQLPNERASLDKMLTTLGLKVNSRVYSRVDPELRESGKYLLKRWKELNQ